MDQIVEFIGNNFVLSGIWIALVVMLAYSFVSGIVSPVKEVTTHEATVLMNKEDGVVVDIRDAKAYKEGHILGAIQLKSAALTKGDFSHLEKYKDKPIIVVCAMGNSSRKAAIDLFKAGFLKSTTLKGGMSAWQSAGLPTSK